MESDAKIPFLGRPSLLPPVDLFPFAWKRSKEGREKRRQDKRAQLNTLRIRSRLPPIVPPEQFDSTIDEERSTGDDLPPNEATTSINLSKEDSLDPLGLFSAPQDDENKSERDNTGESHKGSRIVKEIVMSTVGGFENDEYISREVGYISYNQLCGPELEKHLQGKLKESKRPAQINIGLALSIKSGVSSVPCLKLGNLDREYSEPVRDREKNWIQDSQRDILSSASINEESSQAVEHNIELGAYCLEGESSSSSSELMWASSHQSLLRTQRLMRTSVLISETRCIVTLTGIGVTGRLFSSSPTYISIEAYSIWNSEKLKLELSGPELRSLLTAAGQLYLLKPGNKQKALKYILSLLYFTYKITAETPITPDMRPLHGKPPPIVLEVDHLEDFTLPPCYPQSVTDLMAKIARDSSKLPPPPPPPSMTETHDITVDQGGLESSPPDADVNTARTASEDYIDAPTPVLQQYLRISHIEREVGAARLKRAAIAKKLADEADEAERKKKEAWLAIPRRLRGRVVSRCLRLRCGLFLMFTAYKFPNKPKYMTFSGLVLSSTYRESINFSSNVLVQTLGSDQNYRVRPEEWAPDTLRTIAGKSIAKFTLVDADFKVGKAGIGYNGGGVVEFEFKALRYSLSRNLDLYNMKYSFSGPMRILRGHRQTVNIMELDGWASLDSDQGSGNGKIKHLSPSALSLSSSRVITIESDQPSYLRHTCVRDMDRTRRKLGERSSKIGPAFVIATLYLTSPLISGPIPKYPGDPPLPPLRKDDDDEGEGEDQDYIDDIVKKNIERRKEFVCSMAPTSTFELYLYLPHKCVFSKDLCVPSCSKYHTCFLVSDFLRLVPSIDVLTSAIEALYSTFFDEATPEETTASESAWECIIYSLLKRFSWGVDYSFIAPLPASVPSFKVGEKIEARFQGRKNWYLGVISSCDGDQSSFDISYDDGEVERSVPKELIRYPPETTSEAVTLSLEKQLQEASQLLSRFILNDTYASCPIALKVSSVIYRKVGVKLINETIRSDDTVRVPIFHAYAWKNGKELGFVFYDVEMCQVHMLRQSPELQESMSVLFGVISEFEVTNTLNIFLESEIIYSEVFDEKKNMYIGSVKFISEELPVEKVEEESPIEIAPIVEEDKDNLIVDNDFLDNMDGLEELLDDD